MEGMLAMVREGSGESETGRRERACGRDKYR